MLKSRRIDQICCVVLAVTLLITVLFMNGGRLGVAALSRSIGYEDRLFDQSRVHTIDIVTDDWEGFLESCTDEEYILCDLVIDGESLRNVGLRAKGNSSLTSVAGYGSSRYSFKVEIDHYDSTKSYHGLDKFSLNNIIQDNTYMKDYLVYTMMGDMGVASPLCSFAYITVNGEDWGLYLAVETPEESFLTRNYGSDYGNLYKPDSMDMGGGRGNGKDFVMDDFMEKMEQTENAGQSAAPGGNGFSLDSIRAALEEQGIDTSALPDELDLEQLGPESLQQLLEDLGDIDLQTLMQALSNSGLFPQREIGGGKGGFDREGFGGMENPGGFGGGSFGQNADVKLQYIDDDPDSYANIFDSAKTDITDADKKRLIQSLKSLSENADMEEVLNVEAVIRYFVVHDFVQNGDSYTGSIIHNYYLYEKDGQMEMIPWDYNLAFGGFGGGAGFGTGSAGMTSSVNAPIDSPVSSGDMSDRPMVAWIFESEEYTALYHQIYQEFITSWFDSGKLAQVVSDTAALIGPYVEKDPTAFCSYEEFQTGAAALQEFCRLRAESVQGQLDGRIPSTEEGQAADSSMLIDASDLNASDMGSQGFGGGGRGGQDMDREQMNFGGFGMKDNGNGGKPEEVDGTGSATAVPDRQPESGGGTDTEAAPPEGQPVKENGGGFQPPQNEQPDGFPQGVSANQADNSESIWLLGISAAVLLAGLIFARFYRHHI